MADSSLEVEEAVKLLEKQPDYRVLRRIRDDWPFYSRQPQAHDGRVGAAVDVETTGLDLADERVIELAIQRFRYTDVGEVIEVGVPRSWRQDPGRPLSSEIVRLTGLSDSDLAGEEIDLDMAGLILSSADLIVAHNASFDRPFVDRLLPIIQQKTWACTMTDIDWALQGFEGRSLSYLLTQCGWFYDGHRASNDVLALLYLLAQRPRGKPLLALLLEKVAEPAVEIIAAKAPYEAKDALKKHGYKWNEALRSWRAEVRREDLDRELAWLDLAVYHGSGAPVVRAIGMNERYRGDHMPL